MRSKLFNLLGLSFLALVLIIGGVSATNCLSLTEVSVPSNVDHNGGTLTVHFNLTNGGLCTTFRDNLSWTITSNKLGTWSTSGLPSSINNDTTLELSSTFTFDSRQSGNIETTIYVISEDGNADNDTLILSQITINPIVEPEEITDCAITGNLGNNLNIKIRDISIEEGFGDDEEWYPLDEIEVEVEVENKGPEDIDDIVLAWGLYNVDLDDWVIDDEENDFNLKDGDEETVIITFKLDDPDEFEDNGEYIFYVWATGEDDEFDKNETCISESESIDVIVENDFVVLDSIEFPELVQCGAEIQITADIWNIGEDDQDDVYIIIYNHELGINEQIEIGDLDAFEDTNLNAIIKLPTNAEEKTYSLIFWVYDEDNDVYENSEDDLAEFVVPFKIEGSCVTGPTVLVSANLESGGKAGQELVVRATITNIGNELETYSLNIVGYTDWASSFESSRNIVILGVGEFQDVLLTFEVKKDVSGDKFFNIEVLSGDELIVEQPVSVSIESGFGFPGITGNIISRDNWYLWGIGALNIILVIVIIFVAVRAIRK